MCTCIGQTIYKPLNPTSPLTTTAPSPFNNPGLGQITPVPNLLGGLLGMAYPQGRHIERIDQIEIHLNEIISSLKRIDEAKTDKYIYKYSSSNVVAKVNLETALARIWAELLNIKKEMNKMKEKK